MTGGSTDTTRAPWVERLPLTPPPVLALAAALAAVVAALGLRLLLHPVMPTGMAFVTFFPVVIVVTFLLGARMGLVAALASAVLAWIFFISDPLRPGFVLDSAPAFVPFVLLVAMNIALLHAMQAANAKLRSERARTAALAETRETLFRELQHRVSNNLQVAAGLLALQKKHVTDAAARTAVDEAARRIGVIGRVSRQLYDPSGGARSMRDLLEPLCADVVEMSGRDGVTLTMRAADDVMLEPDAAVPLALIVAETIANAIEHGLANRECGTIEVVLDRDSEGALRVEVRDDGCGLPADFDLATQGSLGLGIVRSLAEQLGGEFEIASESGRTVARLVVPG